MQRKNRDKKEVEAEGKKHKAAGSWHTDLHPETKKAVLAILAFLLAALFVLSFIGKGGAAGGYIFRSLDFLLGKGYFFAPLALILVGFSFAISAEKKVVKAIMVGGSLFLLTSLTILHILFSEGTGGFIGILLGGIFLRFFDFWASIILTIGLFIISLLLTFNIPLKFKKEDAEQKEQSPAKTSEEISGGQAPEDSALLEKISVIIKRMLEKKREETALDRAASINVATETREEPPATRQEPLMAEEALAIRKVAKKFNYTKPPLELLQGDRGIPSSGDIRANANIIKRTLENFGIDVEMGEVSIGPTVTQYTLKPAEGVKLSRITGLHNDLSLALAAHPIRIEAPIPGKSLVGIEMPNRSVTTVGLRPLLEHKIFQESTHPLLFALGKDVSGTPVFADLARMPHLLISGATGSGKSVCAHSIITSFIFRNPPEVLRFILVDPKRVELSVYNDIPHLLTPVITEPKKTIQSLRWATKEMDRRYDLLSQNQVRDIVSYNSKAVKSEGQELLPYVVIIIDELADLMATFPREVEASIIRLAQMARAVGIHLIVSTQRPSVEVITGLIKANITSRIAFQVASQIDSRTILDMSGAEKLLGNGDMLFLAGDTAKPRRIQGGFVPEQEVKRVVDFLREEGELPEYDEKILETKIEEENRELEGEVSGEEDPLYEDARQLVVEAGKASASYLQRRLRVGYARAARLLDLLENRGIIGPPEGAKPREIIIKTADEHAGE